MRVDLEELNELLKKLACINAEELENIEFYKEGKKLEITQETIEKFQLTGLSNVDFITTDYYKKEQSSLTVGYYFVCIKTIESAKALSAGNYLAADIPMYWDGQLFIGPDLCSWGKSEVLVGRFIGKHKTLENHQSIK